VRFCSLGSGSAGNATLVEHGSQGVMTRILLDCGMPLKHLAERLVQRGLTLASIDAVFITHEHSDHIGCARQLVAQVSIPLWMSRGTYHAIGRPDLRDSLRFARDGDTIEIGSLTLHPFAVPHDAKEPLQVIVASDAKRLGLLTDLGHVSRHVLDHLVDLDGLILECNHDLEMLLQSKYPPFLKQRVGGDYGHLSNQQALACLAGIASPKLRHVVAGHLSEQNNTEAIVRNDLMQLASQWSTNGSASISITIANAQSGFEWIEL
jgi:phosphoribosyl 1,2-cyclic phosphodiesterase